jgi:glyoxylase-like metal-dependent hydrolase (beta-lactamase superfamily II)
VNPIAIDQPLTAGELLPIAGGIEVIHAPAHSAGQVALLWRPGRMLFAGDVCMNVMGLRDPVGFESLEDGCASQKKLASLSFDAAGFGHGRPIARDASTHFSVISGAREICLFTLSAGGPHNQRRCSGAHGQVMRKEIRSEFNQVRRRYRQHQGLIESPGWCAVIYNTRALNWFRVLPTRGWMLCERAEGAQPGSSNAT